ncbi:MAG: acyl-CoA dehydrogenase [Frankiaceae bacterium]|nr:acyl-CoA dehydrogenase [Frankiaceae bacterium]
MDFAFSDEQELLRASAKDYLADRFPAARIVELADSDAGWDSNTWKELADLGWLDPELGALEHAVLAEESGYTLLPAPWWSTIGLCGALLDSELRDGVAAGERRVSLAWAETDGPSSISGAANDSATSAEHGTITGTKVQVPDLGLATDVIVVANDGLYAVDVAANPETVIMRSTIDRTRRLGELVLSGTPARKLDAGLDALATARRNALALLACESVGVAQRALDEAASYTKERQQFGRIIGTYQGVSHRVSNTFVALQLARSMAYWAAWAVSAGSDDAEAAVSGAKVSAGEGAVFACEQSIQAHGGIGFTWEHILHRYYKRAQWNNGFEGSGRQHRAAIADKILA